MDSERRPRGIMSAPKLMLDGLTDFVKKRRSPSLKIKPNRDEHRKISAPAGLSQVLPLVGIVATPGTSQQDIRLHSDYTPKLNDVMLTPAKKPSTDVSPVVRVQYDSGRNLLNKKEAGPPSTIKESSESSQTLDNDNESEKGGGQLKHENTVVRADGGGPKTAQPNSTGPQALKNEIVRATQVLLDSISNKDFSTYSRLCDPAMTFFGPEAGSYLVEGIDFHRFQFESQSQLNNSAAPNRVHTTMLNPNVHCLGEEGASIAYVLLTQYIDKNGEPRTRQSQESRVWHKKNGRLFCVHVHRSGATEAL